jgi:putative acetyltransferase
VGLVDDCVAGCVGLRRIDQVSCEMKRLYVRQQYRKVKIGIELAQRVIENARQLRYQRMLLDTLPTMERAQSMYERLGFRGVSAYRHNPIAGTRFLALDLTIASEKQPEITR